MSKFVKINTHFVDTFLNMLYNEIKIVNHFTFYKRFGFFNNVLFAPRYEIQAFGSISFYPP